MCDPDDVTLDPVVAHQDPACKPPVDVIHLIRNRGLCDLRRDDVRDGSLGCLITLQ